MVSKKLISAYVSLAQSYADNQQSHLAIECYKKEIQLRGADHAQVRLSLLKNVQQHSLCGDNCSTVVNMNLEMNGISEVRFKEFCIMFYS
jgi:hypothetical protein